MSGRGFFKKRKEEKTMENTKDIEVTLPSGKVAIIRKAKGYDIEEVQKIINGETSKFMTAFMAQCVTIDNMPVVMEDLREMDADDYLALMSEFSNVNFPSVPGK
jgi:hypothetical protein